MQKENNNRPEYIIRRSNAHDYQAINDAYNRFTGRSRTMEQHLWQWINTPFDHSESWVIEHVASNKIVGHHGVMYLTFVEKGKHIPVGKTENTFVLNDHSKKIYYPGFEKIALKNMKKRFAYIYTTAPDKSRGAVGILRRRLGYKPIGKSVIFGLYFSRAAIKKIIQKRFSLLKSSAGFLSALFSILQGLIRYINKIRVRKVMVTPMSWKSIYDVETFWRRHSKFYGITADRNAAYLRWRYLENPHSKFDIIKLIKEDEVLGYAILKKTKITAMRTNFNVTVIDDLIVAKASESNFYHAITAITNYSSDKELTLFYTLSQTDSVNKAIRRFLWPLSILQSKEGPEILVWGKNKNNLSWYFTNILSEGIANNV